MLYKLDNTKQHSIQETDVTWHMAQTLRAVSGTMLIMLLFAIPLVLLIAQRTIIGLGFVILAVAINFFVFRLSKIRAVKSVATFYLIYLWLSTASFVYLTVDSSSLVSTLFLSIIAMAALFFGLRASVFATAITLSFVSLMLLAESNGLLNPFYVPTASSVIFVFTYSILLLLIPVFLMYRQLAQALNLTQHQVTQLRVAEKTTQESENRYRNLIELSTDLIMIHSDGKIVFINQNGAKLLGYDKSEALIGKPFSQFVKPENLEFFQNRSRKIMKEKVILLPEEVVYVDRNGASLPLEVTGRYYCDDKVEGVQIIARDISQRRQIEETLIESQAMYSAVINQSKDGIMIVQDYKIKFVNPAYLDMVGYTESELIDQPFSNFIHEDDVELVTTRYVERLEGHDVPDLYEMRLIRKDGSILNIEISAQVIKYRRNEASMAIVRDITTRKHQEQALEISQQKLSAAFQNSTDFISISQLESGLFLEANNSAYDVLGYKPNELIGKTATHFEIWVNPQHRQQLVTKIQQEGLLRNEEVLYRHKDGSIRILLLSASLLEIDGTINILAYQRDITESKQYIETLRKSEEKFSKAFQASPDSVTISSIRTGKLIEINEGFETVFGFSRDEAIGKTSPELGLYAIPEDRERMIEILQRDSRIRDLELIGRRKSGELRTCILSVEIIDIENEQCILTIVRDITERKKLETDLRYSQHMLQRIIDESPLSIAIFDPPHSIGKLNKAFSVLLGYEWHSNLLVDLSKHIHPDDLALSAQPIHDPANMHQGHYSLKKRYIRTDGEVRWVEQNSFILFEDNNPVVGVSIVADITEKRKSEFELQHQAQILSFIYALSSRVHQALNPESVAKVAIDEIIHHLDAQVGAVYALDDTQSVLKRLYEYDVRSNKRLGSHLLSMSTSLAGEVVQAGHPLAVSQLRSSDSLYQLAQSALEHLNVYDIIIVPLKYQEEIIGTINIGFTHDQFSIKNSIETLETLANTVGLALGNATVVVALRTSETELEKAQNQSKLGSWTWDLQTQSLNLSKTLYDIFGKRQDSDLKIHHYFNSIHQEDLPTVRELIEKAIDTQDDFYYEHRFIRADRSIGYIWIRAQIHRNSNGDAVRLSGTAQDITERWQIEQSLRESEVRFETAFTEHPASIVISRVTDGLVVDVNKTFLNISGMHRNEIIGKTSTDLNLWLSPSDREKLVSEFRRDGYLDRRELTFRNADGELLTSLSSWNRIEINGEPHILSTFVNITEQKRAENALIESEKLAKEFRDKLRTLHEVSFELAGIDSLDELYTQAVRLGVSNLGFERIGLLLVDDNYTTISGVYGSDEVGGIRDETDIRWQLQPDSREIELIHSQARAKYKEDVPLMSKGRIVGRGWDILSTLWDGNRILGLLSTDNYHTGQAVKPYMVDLMTLYGGVLGHLISRKLREIEVSKYIEQLKMLQQIDRSILLEESPTKISERIIEPMQELLKCHFIGITRYDAETGVIVALASNMHEDETARRKLDSSDIKELLSQEYIVVDDLYNKVNRRLGEDRLLEFGVLSYTIYPMRNNNELTGTMYIGINKTGTLSEDQIEIAQQVATQLAIVFRQAELDERLQQYASNLAELVQDRTAQLEAKTQELEAFNYSVSHDLRAPLRAISVFSHTLQEDYANDLPDKAQFLLNRININAGRMGQFINDLLALSRLGRKQMDIELLDMTQIVKEIVAHYELDNQVGQAEITIDKLPDCKGDKTLIEQVWNNLISNALKYSAKMVAPQIEIGTHIQNNNIVYYIKDNGVGFDMEYYHRLFGVFERLVSDDEFDGTGIGLAIIKRIITRHNGEVWAESQLNQGATFYFTIGKLNE